MREVEIIDPSSSDSDIMKLRNFKNAAPAANPTIVTALPVPLKVVDTIMELFMEATGDSLSPSED